MPLKHEPEDHKPLQDNDYLGSGEGGMYPGVYPKPENADADPELTRVVAAWPILPQVIRAGIVAMVAVACPS